MRLILVRHGYTDDLKYGIVQGHRETPLNRQGKNQARRAARALRHYTFHRIYSSDSMRARQTADLIATHHPKVTIVHTPLLRERSSGLHEGRSYARILRKYKQKIKTKNWRPPRGESQADLFLRAKKWFLETRRRHPRSTILVVSHGGLLRSLLTYIFHGPKIQFRPEYSHDNTGISTVSWRKGKPQLVIFNDTNHLGKKVRLSKTAT